MSDKIVPVQFGPRAPSDLPAILRELADATERGEVTGMVFAYLRDDQYQTGLSASPQNALVMSTILHRRTVDKLFE